MEQRAKRMRDPPIHWLFHFTLVYFVIIEWFTRNSAHKKDERREEKTADLMTVICSAKNNNKTKKQVTIVAPTLPKRKFFSQWEEYSFSLSYDCTLWSKFPVMNENENSCFLSFSVHAQRNKEPIKWFCLTVCWFSGFPLVFREYPMIIFKENLTFS